MITSPKKGKCKMCENSTCSIQEGDSDVLGDKEFAKAEDEKLNNIENLVLIIHSTPKESIHFVILRVLKRNGPLKSRASWDLEFSNHNYVA